MGLGERAFGDGGRPDRLASMTITETPAASTDPETREVDAAIDALLAAHDPKTTDNVDVPRRSIRRRVWRGCTSPRASAALAFGPS